MTRFGMRLEGFHKVVQMMRDAIVEQKNIKQEDELLFFTGNEFKNALGQMIRSLL